MTTNSQVIQSFYEAFAERDAEKMVALYSQNIIFSDPVFPSLKGEQACHMWRMLSGRAKDLKITFGNIHAEGNEGRAHWEAHYTFLATGRKVHNSIDAKFVFKDGKIIKHTDIFNFWRWSRQAMGPLGLVLGWTPFLQKKVQATAALSLLNYTKQRS